jgi:transcriptional regulator with XRE-family HTH domain
MGIINGGPKKPLPKAIPERIREAREARGLAPEEFAELLNVSRQAVAQFETGQISPSGEVMAKIIAVTAQPPLFFVTPRERARTGAPDARTDRGGAFFESFGYRKFMWSFERIPGYSSGGFYSAP